MLFHFNSHAHVERDIYGALFFGDYDHFNSHAHVERDNKPQPYLQILTNFNSHAHVERDPQLYLLKPSQGISTHTLTWSVTSLCISSLQMSFNFNSHAHVERDYLFFNNW